MNVVTENESEQKTCKFNWHCVLTFFMENLEIKRKNTLQYNFAIWPRNSTTVLTSVIWGQVNDWRVFFRQKGCSLRVKPQPSYFRRGYAVGCAIQYSACKCKKNCPFLGLNFRLGIQNKVHKSFPKNHQRSYRISANSFCGSYSFLNLASCTFVRKLFKGGNYLWKYGI